MPGPKKKIDYNEEIKKVDRAIADLTTKIANLRTLRK